MSVPDEPVPAGPDGAAPSGAGPGEAHVLDTGELEAILALAVELATAAAGVLVTGAPAITMAASHPHGGRPGAWTRTKSSPTDHVTDVDHASEQLIVEGILGARPHDGILGEEGSARAGTSGLRWVIDPLDGTTNFVFGLPAYAVSIGVELDGRAVAGVVVDAARSETFSATLGGGAWLGGDRLACRATPDLPLALIGTGFSYDAHRRARQGAVLAGLLPGVRDVRRVGAAAIDLCWVACGRLDGYYEQGLQPWDLAAGALIAAEAGAAVTDLDGGPPTGAMVVAANPVLAGLLRSRLGALGAEP